jgi:hypothetical protein
MHASALQSCLHEHAASGHLRMLRHDHASGRPRLCSGEDRDRRVSAAQINPANSRARATTATGSACRGRRVSSRPGWYYVTACCVAARRPASPLFPATAGKKAWTLSGRITVAGAFPGALFRSGRVVSCDSEARYT